jgi:hypothetical protein
MEKPSCDNCKALKKDKFDIEDCKECVPDILEENEDAEKIYFVVQDQYIMGFNGAVGINQMAIHAAMDLYEVEDRLKCFEGVVSASRHFISKQQELNDLKANR